MTIRGLSVALPTIVAACAVVVSAQVPRVINLTGNDSLHYSPTTITATPGETITVVLRTISMQPAAQMAHNFVILKPGANVDQFTMLAGMARDHDFIPPKLKDQILVATPMAAANEVAKATFTAPTTPGTYVYFCTYPAHYSGGMKGTLVVKYDRRHTGCSNTGVTSPPRCPMSHADSERLLVLMDHIITTHHDYVRRAIPDITRRLRSLSAAAGPERAELPVVLKTFEHLALPLLSHLDKEEHLLFPYIKEMVVAAAEGRQMPTGPFGSVVHPLRMMEEEHESASEDLLILDELTRHYTPPPSPVPGLADAYAALKRFDADLREHIRKEDHDLFPATLDLEGRFM